MGTITLRLGTLQNPTRQNICTCGEPQIWNSILQKSGKHDKRLWRHQISTPPILIEKRKFHFSYIPCKCNAPQEWNSNWRHAQNTIDTVFVCHPSLVTAWEWYEAFNSKLWMSEIRPAKSKSAVQQLFGSRLGTILCSSGATKIPPTHTYSWKSTSIWLKLLSVAQLLQINLQCAPSQTVPPVPHTNFHTWETKGIWTNCSIFIPAFLSNCVWR